MLSQRENRRYSKQIMIPEIGTAGQELLKNARVLVIGAGGLGCPVLQYLTAAGVGNIGIVEFDTVDESNLQRQVLYGSEDLGKLKSVIAKTRLQQLNVLINVDIYNLKCDSTNAPKIFKNYDIIVDATDNLESRYVINDACVTLGKPMVHGSIYKYEGVVSVFNYKGGPSYRAFYPESVKSDFLNPAPAAVGLFGVLPGLTGTYMANEVIKIITGTGDLLSGKALLINVSTNTFRIFTI
jgi:sulfur-carrier protein adenylyltransferase/sulfurtransferase